MKNIDEHESSIQNLKKDLKKIIDILNDYNKIFTDYKDN